MSNRFASGKKKDVMKKALNDAIRYQLSLIDAWTPEQPWVKISDDVQIMIDDANKLIADYQRILGGTFSL